MWRTARSPVSTFLPHFVRRFTPTNMQYAHDYFATRHLLAACLCAVLLVIIDARWFRYHRGVDIHRHGARTCVPWFVGDLVRLQRARRSSDRIVSNLVLFFQCRLSNHLSRTNLIEHLFRRWSNFMRKNRLNSSYLICVDNRCCIRHLDLAFPVSSLVQFQGNWK